MQSRIGVAFLAVSVSVTSPLFALSTPRARQDLPPISRLPNADRPQLRPLGIELTPRNFEWTLSGGSGLQACPNQGRCSGPPAWLISTGVSARPVSWFSWGINGEVTHRHQLVTLDGYHLNHVRQSYGALLFARVHWLTEGRSDIYTSLGLGLGLIDSTGALTDTAHRTYRLTDSAAPETDVAFGWRWRFGPFLSAGLELHLRYWVTPGDARCGRLAQRSCPFADDAPLPRDSLLWSLQLAGAVGFGQAL